MPDRKLTPEQVATARRDYRARRADLGQLAAQLDLPREDVWRMLRGDTYADCKGPLHRGHKVNPRRKLTRKQVEAMRIAYSLGQIDMPQIAATYSLAIETVNLMLQGKTYADCPGPLHTPGPTD